MWPSTGESSSGERTTRPLPSPTLVSSPPTSLPFGGFPSLFSAADTNKDGVVSSEEFSAFKKESGLTQLEADMTHPHPATVEDWHSHFDGDGDGHVAHSDFHESLSQGFVSREHGTTADPSIPAVQHGFELAVHPDHKAQMDKLELELVDEKSAHSDTKRLHEAVQAELASAQGKLAAAEAATAAVRRDLTKEETEHRKSKRDAAAEQERLKQLDAAKLEEDHKMSQRVMEYKVAQLEGEKALLRTSMGRWRLSAIIGVILGATAGFLLRHPLARAAGPSTSPRKSAPPPAKENADEEEELAAPAARKRASSSTAARRRGTH